MVRSGFRIKLMVGFLLLSTLGGMTGIAFSFEIVGSYQQVTNQDHFSSADSEWEDIEDESDTDPFSDTDDLNTVAAGETGAAKEEKLVIGGFIKFDSTFAWEKSEEKLSRLESILNLESEFKPNDETKIKISGQAGYDASYDLMSKDRYTGQNQDDKAAYTELRDLYLDSRLMPNLSVRLGRQIIAWGETDYARIIDVINPRDLTRPGLIDLEDARLPVTAARLTYTNGPWNLEGVSIHEFYGSRISGTGADFDYFLTVRNPQVFIHDKDIPGFSFDDPGFALKVNYAFNGGDLALMAGQTYDDQPYLDYQGMDNGLLRFTPEYDQFSLIGMTASVTKGSALFKFETRYAEDKRIMRSDIITQIGSGIPQDQVKTSETADQLTALAGFEYTGFSDLRLTFETAVTHTLDYQSVMATDENEIAIYFQATQDLFHETVELDLLWVNLQPGNGNIVRVSGGWDIVDNVNIQTGIVFYTSDSQSSPLDPYQDRDRVFFRLKYSF